MRADRQSETEMAVLAAAAEAHSKQPQAGRTTVKAGKAAPSILAALPLHPYSKLNDAGIIRLAAQIDQTSGRIRSHIDWMVEYVEEVAAESHSDPFAEREILEERSALRPPRRAQHEVAGVGTGKW